MLLFFIESKVNDHEILSIFTYYVIKKYLSFYNSTNSSIIMIVMTN